jgi:diaminopimelate decarboxylase
MLAEDVINDVVSWVTGMRIPTPCYLFSSAGVQAGVAQLRKHLPGRISYVTKANAHPRMLRELKPLVDEFNVTNPVHLDALLAMDIDPTLITFLNPVSTPETIAAVVARGVTRFVVDDVRGLHQLRTLGGQLRLTLRLQPPDLGEPARSVIRFGSSARMLRELAWEAAEIGAQIEAVSFCVGTAVDGMGEALPFRRGIEELARLREQLERDGVAAPAVNIGGGFPGSRQRFHADYPDFFPRIAQYLAQYLPAGTDVVCEPGRFLCEPSMGILARVITDRVVAGRRLVYLDTSAFVGLFDTSLIKPGGLGLDIGYAYRAAPVTAADVLGPIMDSFDVLKRNALLPSLTEGEVLVLPNVGAYSWEYSARCEGLGDLDVVDLPEDLDASFATAWYEGPQDRADGIRLDHSR